MAALRALLRQKGAAAQERDPHCGKVAGVNPAHIRVQALTLRQRRVLMDRVAVVLVLALAGERRAEIRAAHAGQRANAGQ